MDGLTRLAERLGTPLLRISMAVILIWIGGLKFADPSPVVGLLDASFSFLAFDAFVYLLGTVEVIAGGLLLVDKLVPYVGLLLVGLFAGTLVIFLIAPAVTYGEGGFPFLTLPGEFLLKDLVLLAGALMLMGMGHPAERPRTAQP